MSAKTIVTTVRLPPELHEALRRRASEERRPVAEILREAVVAWLASAETAATLPALERDPLWACVGSVGGGPSDEAERHDDHLYADRVGGGVPAEPVLPLELHLSEAPGDQAWGREDLYDDDGR